MKKIKYIVYPVFALLLLFFVFGFIVRWPSYSIKTNGKLYVFNKKSEDITVFDLAKGREITTIPVAIESHGAAKLLGKNKLVIANYNTKKYKHKKILIFNIDSNKVEKTISFSEGVSGLEGIVSLPIANKVGVVSAISNEFLVINTQTETIEQRIPTKQKGSHFFVIHPKLPIAYISNRESGSVSVVNLITNQLVKNISCGKGAIGIDCTPDGSEIWVTNRDDNSISIINTSKNEVSQTLKTGKQPISLKFSREGKYCLVANLKDGTISVFDQKSKKVIVNRSIHGKQTAMERALYHTPWPVNIVMHPNGLYAFISNSNANNIQILDMHSFDFVSEIQTGEVPEAMVLIE
ncbi:YncE family protein [Flavobacterium flavipallidum]|uniref:YncE family protein n=1 Tax=Flavobacterium flavipallidum TaxID=3139140 RepID=A0ABU9HIS2_9FLAO